MIRCRKDYLRYVAEDMAALGAKSAHPLWSSANSMVWLTDPVARWERLLRRVEYWENCRSGAVWKPIRVFLRWRFQCRSAQLGFSIPLNTCGPGLCILHYGSIVISRHSRLGANCTLNSWVNIGARPGEKAAPAIGDGCYIGPGAKLWGGIAIADGVVVGANTCVSKDVLDPGCSVVGVNRVILRESKGKEGASR